MIFAKMVTTTGGERTIGQTIETCQSRRFAAQLSWNGGEYAPPLLSGASKAGRSDDGDIRMRTYAYRASESRINGAPRVAQKSRVLGTRAAVVLPTMIITPINGDAASLASRERVRERASVRPRERAAAARDETECEGHKGHPSPRCTII